jgi:carbon starvation protein
MRIFKGLIILLFVHFLVFVNGCLPGDKCDELLQKNATQQERIDELESLNQAQQNQLAQLKSKNESQEQHIIQLQSQKQTQNRQIIQLEHQNQAHQNKVAELTSQNKAQQEQIISLKSKNETQQTEIAELENLHREEQNQIAQLNTQVQNLESKLKELSKAISALRTEVRLKDKLLEVTIGDSFETIARIKPDSAVTLVTFEIEDPNIATIEPTFASFSSQTLRVIGVRRGQTHLIVRAQGRSCTEATIKVKSPSLIAKLSSASKGPLSTLFLMLICGGGYLVAYHTYGRFLARKIFKLNKDAIVPSVELQDGIDYVPARKGIIFGHHYTSIAGTGPIVGPAIGIIWGWLPAILWVFLGSIFMGAVHDFGALVVSLRNQGKSISEAAAKYINARVRFIFFAVVFLSLLIVIAIFGVVIATVFARFPSSVMPVWLQIPIAMALGYAVYKKGMSVPVATAVAVLGMYLCIAVGSVLPVELGSAFGIPSTGLWVIILLIYAWVASTLPVTVLLQPRDYINAWQLFIAMGLLIGGTVAASVTGGLPLVAPVINTSLPENTPPIWPFMFVVIACGAISGFHSLVASGTSCKQIAKEPDSQFVGYGSMILESFLAVLVIICVGAGVAIAVKLNDGTVLSGKAAWLHYYDSWLGAKGLSDKIAPVVVGAANMMAKLRLPETVGVTLMGVFIASFAGTTLDTSVRIQRYVVSELATDLRIPFLTNRWSATTFVVLVAAGLAFATGASGTGAMKLWPLFGSSNQLLAALALLVVTIYLKHKGGAKFLVTAIPCLIMLVVTNWAMVKNEIIFFRNNNWLLVGIGAGIFILALWMTFEAFIVFVIPKRTE